MQADGQKSDLARVLPDLKNGAAGGEILICMGYVVWKKGPSKKKCLKNHDSYMQKDVASNLRNFQISRFFSNRLKARLQ